MTDLSNIEEAWEETLRLKAIVDANDGSSKKKKGKKKGKSKKTVQREEFILSVLFNRGTRILTMEILLPLEVNIQNIPSNAC